MCVSRDMQWTEIQGSFEVREWNNSTSIAHDLAASFAVPLFCLITSSPH
jgi:hypothetical protein